MSQQSPDCTSHPQGQCRMDGLEFNTRMNKIENELEQAREARLFRNAQQSKVMQDFREEQVDAERRICLMESLLQKVTQLLEGYMSHQGLVETVKEHGLRLEKIERKIYLAVGGLTVLQIVIGAGVFIPFFKG